MLCAAWFLIPVQKIICQLDDFILLLVLIPYQVESSYLTHLQQPTNCLALKRTAELMVSRSDSHYDTPWQIATLFIRAGVKDKAIVLSE